MSRSRWRYRRYGSRMTTGQKALAAGVTALVLAGTGGHGHGHHGGGGAALFSMAGVPSGGSYSQQSWSRAFLRAAGFPRTSANVASVVAWQQREGGGGANNPLNSTQPEPGASCFNSVCVRNYTSERQGIKGNLTALFNGYYGDVVDALRSGSGLCGQSFSGLSTWSGGGYSSVC